MSDDVSQRTEAINMKITLRVRRMIEQLAAHLTIKTGERHTLTDVMELGVEELGKREKVKIK